MRKTYLTPAIRPMRIGTTEVLATSSLPVDPSNTASDAGWSKQFWGLTEDDEDSKSEFEWQ